MGLTFDKSSIEGIYGSTFADGNTVSLLYKGRESFQAIFSSIENAQLDKVVKIIVSKTA